MKRAKHSFLLCPIFLSCLVMNKIGLNQTKGKLYKDNIILPHQCSGQKVAEHAQTPGKDHTQKHLALYA